MDIQLLVHYFREYGGIAIFIVVLLEYMNLPGFPSGVIMPLAGIWAAQGNIGFVPALLLSVLAGLCGSWILYAAGRIGGPPVLERWVRKFPKHEARINKSVAFINEKGYWGVFAGKLIPVVRTLISLMAGVAGMNVVGYTVYSALGIAVWNFAFMAAGYWFSDAFFQWLQ